MSPAQILLARFSLEAMLASTPSATGKQIEALRDGMQPNRDGWRGDALERKRQQYADLVLLTKDLNQDELRVCRYRYGCTAGIERYERIVTTSDLDDAERWQGETMLPGRMGAVADNPHLRKVVGTRARLPDFNQIAQAFAVEFIKRAGEGKPWADSDLPSARQVKRLLESARQKVATAIKWRTMQVTIEERYE